MSVLGKDLFDFQRSHTNTKVEFGASGYWVEMVPEMQPYGTVLTEILNLDVTPFQKLLDRLNTAVHEKNYDDAPRAYMDMQKGFGSLPLYRLYLMDFRYFGDMKIEEFVGEEVREAFAKYVINEESEIPSFMQQQIKDIQLIQERYAWFLDRVFANAVFEKKKGQRKESLAQLIYSSGYEAFVSGVSLGKDPEVDAPLVRAQYRIRGERENAEVVEKMYFDRLLDFVYVELMKEAAKKVEDGIEETLTYCDFPSEHWTRIRTNNVIERLNREIRRRTRVVGTFPDGNSALMLVCARLRHVAGTQWGNKKYMNMKHLEAALDDTSIAG